MANYFNTLNLRQQLAQLGKCRFMARDEFADGASYLQGKKVVIVGCGAQGLNQGLNMRDSGLDISYALRKEAIAEKRASWRKATENGFKVGTYEELIPPRKLIFISVYFLVVIVIEYLEAGNARLEIVARYARVVQQAVIPAVRARLVIYIGRISEEFDIMRHQQVRVFRADVVPVTVTPVEEVILVGFFQLFHRFPYFKKVGTQPFPIDERVRNVLPSRVPVFRGFLFRKQFGAGTQEFPHVAEVGHLQQAVFFLPRVYEMLCGHCHFCLIQVHDVLHYGL